MACFVVPAAEAIAVTVAWAVAKKKENKIEAPKLADGKTIGTDEVKITWTKKLGWLMSMLWGGVLLLVVDHIWSGELVAFPPFLTAMSSPEGISQMLHEIATVGVSMVVTITAFWGGMCAVADLKLKARLRKKSA